MTSTTLYDITIIGGGPVGLYAAFYAGMRQAKTKIIESLDLLGGQPAHLYPEKKIYDIPAHYALTGAALTEALIKQLSHFDTTICLGEEALNITETPEGYYQITTNKSQHLSKTLIIAIGNGAFRPRKLTLPDAAQYEQTNVHYFVRDPQQFAGRVVAICGGGDSAVDWALTLEPIAKHVYLIHRRPQFRALEHSVQQLEQSNVTILTPYIPAELMGDGTTLQHIKLQVPRQDEFKTLSVDDFIVSYGFVSSIGAVSDWQLTMNRQTIVTELGQTTNRPGIYAIGDIAHYEGKVKLIATGFGEATNAVNHALHYLHPELRQGTVHSTSLFEQ